MTKDHKVSKGTEEMMDLMVKLDETAILDQLVDQASQAEEVLEVDVDEVVDQEFLETLDIQEHRDHWDQWE